MKGDTAKHIALNVASQNTTSLQYCLLIVANTVIHHNHKSNTNETNNIIDELHKPSLAPSAFPLNLCTSVPFDPEPNLAVADGSKVAALVPTTRALSFGASDIVVPDNVLALLFVRAWISVEC